jgi:hypothetical protein
VCPIQANEILPPATFHSFSPLPFAKQVRV